MPVYLDKHITINEFYTGRHVLITGGTGFIGKVLIEKFLRSVPGVAGLHVIIRPKKGLTIAERIKKITSVPLFDLLREKNPNFMDKIFPVAGDVLLPNLGLSAQDRESLVKNVSVVIHVAATVRFDDPLHRAILLNVRGTRDVALLAREMPNLVAFEHVSTTYCQIDKKVIEEKLYPPPADWKTMIAAAEKLDSATLNIITTKLMGKFPNTYCYSKALAEQCVCDVLKGKQLVVARPVVVISTLLDPVKGWIDNFNGPAGLMTAAAKGVIHIVLGRSELISDYIPVDLVVRLLIWCPHRHGLESVVPDDPPTYNIASATLRPVTTGEVRDMGRKAMKDVVMDNMISEPLNILTSNKTLFWIGTIIFHLIPAVIIDAALRLAGRKPLLMSIQRRVYAAQIALSPFLLNSWVFKNGIGFREIRNLLPEDLAEFKMDYIDIDVNDYFKNVAYGARRYLLKEKDEDLPKARQHRHRLIIFGRTFLVLITAWLLYVIPFTRIATALAHTFVSLFEISED